MIKSLNIPIFPKIKKIIKFETSQPKGETIKLSEPFGYELPKNGFTVEDNGYQPPESDGSHIEVVIKDNWIESKCGWTPFNNCKVKGFPVATIVNGEIVMENNKILSNAKGKPLNF